MAASALNSSIMYDASIIAIRHYLSTNAQSPIVPDPRKINFAHHVAKPIIAAMKKSNGDNTFLQQCLSIYTNAVESFYMLDRECRSQKPIDLTAQAVRSKGPKILVQPDLVKRPFPVPFAVLLDSIDPALSQPFIDLCKKREFEDGREIQRKIYSGLCALEPMEDGSAILSHALKYVASIDSLSKILSLISLTNQDKEFSYPFDADSDSKILLSLKTLLLDKNVGRLQLGPDRLMQYMDRLEIDSCFARIGTILTALSSYPHYKNSAQISLIRELICAELDNKYNTFRYSGPIADQQLAVLGNHTSSWIDNTSSVRLVGKLDALASHIEAVKRVLPKLVEQFDSHYETSFSHEVLADLNSRLNTQEEQLRSGNCNRKDLGFQTALLREQVSYAELIDILNLLSTDNYKTALEKADAISKKKSKNPLLDSARWVYETLDQPVYRNARKIKIKETDDLETMLSFGEKPVPHCQNWKNNSSYNQTLLSFPSDANKKLYVFSDENDQDFGMSMIRLIDTDGCPTLLVENLYSNEWSDDYGLAFLDMLSKKAASMASETGKCVRIAVPLQSGHAGHGARNIQVGTALDQFEKKHKVEVLYGNFEITAAPSRNTKEYWDCGPGIVDSGKKVNLELKYVQFGGSDEEW